MAEETKSESHEYKGFGTLAIHAGQPADPRTGAVVVPISLSATFQQPSPGVHKGYEYARTGNPTRDAFEANVAALEQAKHGIAFGSGLAATTTLLHLLKAGDHVISMDDVYGGTRRYFTRIASNFGLTFTFLDLNDTAALEAAFTPNTKMVWLETPTNPTLKIVDIMVTARITHAHNAILVVDNTFLSPYFQKPITLGADIVIHSVTKYLNGHSDVVMGVICTNDENHYSRLKFLQNGMGCIPSPFDSFLAMRGVKTLHIRCDRHQHNALAIARMLEAHPKVEKVIYPGLESHPQHELAKRQMSGFGGMVTFYLKSEYGLPGSRAFLENLKLFALAESLGGVESLVDHPALMTHLSVPPEERLKLGILDTLVRLSVGIEDVEDLKHDLLQALDKV